MLILPRYSMAFLLQDLLKNNSFTGCLKKYTIYVSTNLEKISSRYYSANEAF